MNKRNKYIAPKTEVISTQLDCSILQEKSLGIGDERYKIVDGDLDDGEEVAAKPHNIWDDEE